MERSQIDDIRRRDRDAAADRNATIQRSRETLARAHQLIDSTKTLIARARRRSRRAA